MNKASQIAAALETVMIDNLFTLQVGVDGTLFAYALPQSPIDEPVAIIELHREDSIEHFSVKAFGLVTGQPTSSHGN